MAGKGIQLMVEEVAELELQHINVKLLLKDPANLDLQTVVPVFHSWIQEQPFSELLLDVADYTHVKDGPGLLLIGHEADYSIDNTDGRPGVRYNRKAPLNGSNRDKLVQGFLAVLEAAKRLEHDVRLKEAFKVNGQDFEVLINDRLLAANTEEMRQSVDADLRRFFDRLFGVDEYSLQYERDPRKLFGAMVHTQQAFSIGDLLRNLSGAT
jgi:hypothetical protein